VAVRTHLRTKHRTVRERRRPAADASAGGRPWYYPELWELQSRFLPRADGHLDPEALRHIRLFEGLDDASIRAISLLLATEHYPAFSEVLREGDPNEKLFLIARGSVETFRDDGRDRYAEDLGNGSARTVGLMCA